ncbi:MAG: TolB family protein [Candidatus Ratteibacteria bacterium]
MKRYIKFLFFLFLLFYLSIQGEEEKEGPIAKNPVFSPDGKKIYFASDVAYGITEIWVINIDGTGLKRLKVIGEEPMFSPDGTKIVYKGPGGISIMDPDGTGQRKAEKNEYSFRYSKIEKYSPDGKKTLFIYRPSDATFPTFNIYIENIDGTERRQLTFGNYWDTNPNWHPSGQKIIFHSNRENMNGIWEVNIDGTELRCINKYGDYPVYSKDGTKIAFVRDGNIWVMNSDGKDERQLTFFDQVIEPRVVIKFDPDKWNIEWLDEKQGTGYINCYIGGIEGKKELGIEGYSAEEINPDTIKLEYKLSPDGLSQILNSHPGFSDKVLKLKFKKFEAIKMIQNLELGYRHGIKNYKLTITGYMKDGQYFYGETEIEIIGKEKNKELK